ncbi:MAG: sensor signal transduction histidine kinase [Phycisphaerales bacterium]|nr:sensor signal transduction histidine kinase [Phycisphaerales bacterium]
MRHRPFFVRLIVVFAGLVAAIVAVCGGTIYLSGQRAVRAQQIADLGRLAPLVRQWLAEGQAGPDGVDAATRAKITDAGRLLDTRISVIAGDGRVVVDTLVPAATLDNHNDRPEVVAARRREVGSGVRPSLSLHEEAVYVAELVDPGRPDGLVVRVSYPQRSWSRYGVPVWQVLGAGVGAAVLAVAALWLALQRWWVGPTNALAAAAGRMAGGDWAARADPRGADELRAFSGRLNEVAAHAQRQVADLRRQQADLQALVDTLPDPVLRLDPGGAVALINRPAARLLNLSRGRALGRHVASVVNDDAVLRLVDQINADDGGPGGGRRGDEQPGGAGPAGGGTVTREVRLARDGQWLTYQAVAQRTADGGALLVLRDVTALTAAVQMKTDFVANASHELRTPIAAIKIAFETLRDVYADGAERADLAQADKCVQIIDGHLRRLEDMLRDLLDLSRVENPHLKPTVRRLRTADVMAGVRSSLGPLARQKLVELVLDEPGARTSAEVTPHEFLCDERLLGLVLKNLVENSVKFTPPGGAVSVELRLAEPTAVGAGLCGTSGGAAGEPAVRLTVRDTGAGIPPEHLDRVFERFYQVDPARSGSAGRGTGLGLAIVKHAVAALGGAIEIESTVGQGTAVTCTIPQVEPEVEDEERG